MDLNGRPARTLFWVMTWLPLGLVLFGPDDWGHVKRLLVGLAGSAALFVLTLALMLAHAVLTGRDPRGID